MGDWFDFNNDGKLDFFEETCKWDHIQRSVNRLNEEANNKVNNRANNYSYNANNSSSSPVWDKICFVVGLVFVIAVIVFLGYLINLF